MKKLLLILGIGLLSLTGCSDGTCYSHNWEYQGLYRKRHIYVCPKCHSHKSVYLDGHIEYSQPQK